MAWPETLRVRFPVITLSLAVVSLITCAVPTLTPFFVYDRQLVLEGQLWRLFTAPFVHFSGSHLLWNLLVFVAAGCATELAGYRRFGLVCILSIVVPGLLFLTTKPDLAQYGGLSAIATGSIAYLCLCRAIQAHTGRGLWLAMFALLIMKIFVETAIDSPIFAQSVSLPFRVLPSAHIVGVVAAVVTFFSEKHKMGQMDAV